MSRPAARGRTAESSVSRRVAVLLCCAVAAVLGGCGEPAEDTTSGSLVLTVHTSGQLQGDDAQDARDGADAAKLALREADGMVGEFTVNLVTLDDTDPDTGRWGAEQAVANARRAIADRNIIAYIGDTSSGATALTLPLLNEAGVLQIGPQSGYVGLTRPAGRGEPERFYPSGKRSFGRRWPIRINPPPSPHHATLRAGAPLHRRAAGRRSSGSSPAR